MSWKDTNITNPGTSIKYGADDMELVSRLFNGVTSGVPAVTIKSTNKFGFWDNVLFVRNQADTFNMTIRGPVTMTAARDLALPSITANDTLAAIGLTNVFSVKQQLEAGTLLKQQSSPSNPSSTYHHLFVNTSGHLVKRNSSGVETDYDNQVFSGSTAVLKDYSARVYNTGGTYFAYDSSGTLISSGTTFETVAQAALNPGGTVLFAGPTTLACSSGFTGLSVPTRTHVVVERGCTITVPQGYTGYVFRPLNVERWILDIKGLIDEAGTPSRNWTGIQVESTTTTVIGSHILHAHINNASTGLKIIANGAAAFVMMNSFHSMMFKDCRKAITFTETASGSIDNNMFADIMIQALAATTTDGIKDVTGMENTFDGCMFDGNTGSMNEMNILNTADNTFVIGGNIGSVVAITDASLTTQYFNASVGAKFDSGFMKLKNPAGSFYTTIKNSAQTANRDLTIPVLSQNSTLPVLEQTNVFTTLQKVQVDGSAFGLDLNRTDNAIGNQIQLNFNLQDSALNLQNYARVAAEIVDPTNTSEDGILRFYVSVAGTMTNVFSLDATGPVFTGAGSLAPPLTLQGDPGSDFIYLYRTTSTLNNNIDLNFDMQDALGNRETYCDLRTSIIDNVNGSEDGRFQVNIMDGGTKREMLRIQTGDFSIIDMVNDPGIYFDSLNSVSAQKHQAYFRSYWDDNTNGSEDGGGDFGTLLNGVETDIFGFDTGGLYVGKQLRVTRDATSSLFELYRTDNSVGNTIDFNWFMDSSTGVKRNYSRIECEIDDATNTSEDAHFVFRNMWNGTLQSAQKFYGTGDMDVIHRANTTNDLWGLNLLALNSISGLKTYNAIGSKIIDNTSGSEDGTFWVDCVRNSTLNRVLEISQNGRLAVGPSSADLGTVTRNVARSTVAAAFSNTTAEQTLFSQNILGNTMGAQGILHMTIIGAVLQNTATATNWTLRIKFGGTTIYEDLVLSGYATTSANFLPWILDFYLFNANATNAQTLSGTWTLNDTSSPVTGYGDITDDESQGNAVFAWSSAKDTTADQTLAVTMQMSNANANIQTTVDMKLLQINPSI